MPQVPQPGTWTLLWAYWPGEPAKAVGVLLLDIRRNKLYVRLRDEPSQMAVQDDVELWKNLAGDLIEKASELGGAEVMDWLCTTLSHVFRIDDCREIEVLDFPDMLNYLFREYVLAIL